MRQILAVFLVFVGFTNFALAESAEESAPKNFVAGQHYKVLDVPVKTPDPSKVEVVESFSYMCVHCFNFDPYVEAWKRMQEGDVDFKRMPASFNPDWELMAHAFYTAETLGITAQVHEHIFDGLHNKRQDLRKPENLRVLFSEIAGVSEEDFAAAYNSFSVQGRVRQSNAKTRAYRVTGVPTMIVNGKYLVDGTSAGGNIAMLHVVDFLIDLERQGLTSAE
ncbi:MAG: thiol:disulfide interchange protein DsbA/DsbL [Pseudomonadota bacterium]